MLQASAKGQWIEQRSINRFSTYALIKVVVKNQALILAKPELTENSIEMLSRNNGEDLFKRGCGDEFIIGY